MSNSPLVCHTKISPNSTNPRNDKIRKITIHHMAGNASIETCGNVFAVSSKRASSNYGVGTDGRIGMYVEEKNRAWTSSNAKNDNQAVTIEVANDGGAPDWHVSDKALASTIDLCTDICKRNGIEKLVYTGDATGNLTEHNYFAATACPGPYLKSKLPYIAEQVNKRLADNGATSEKPDSGSTYPKVPFLVEVLVDNLGYYAEPRSGGKARGVTKKGVFTIVEVSGDWGKLKSGAGWINLSDASKCKPFGDNAAKEEAFKPYMVEVSISNLNIRKGPGTNYGTAGVTGKGVFTIVEEASGQGSSSGWGKLKSGAGWISLDYTKRFS